MSKTLIGIVTFGNFLFTKLGIEAIGKTTHEPYDFLVVVGKPGDGETIAYLASNGIPYIVHEDNYGFPYSLNDLYQKAFEHGDYDNLIIMGNDVIPYPTTIDSLIRLANKSDYGWISACEFEVKGLVKEFPETAPYFDINRNYAFTDFDARPWEVFTAYEREKVPTSPGLSDIHNLALYKKIVYDTIGFVDVNFYPAYYSDNDYARRGVNAGLSSLSCTLTNAFYFHFWSRTIHQGNNVILDKHHKYFRANAQFYVTKWGGGFGQESNNIPFGGERFMLSPDIILDPVLNIQSREQEKDIVDYWKNLATV